MTSYTPKAFEAAMYKALETKGHITQVRPSDVLPQIDKESIIKLTTHTYEIKFNDDTILYVDKNNETFICQGYGINMSLDGEWLSNKLIDIPFDIECDGNLRKAEEASAAYMLANIVILLNDELFREEFKEVIDTYDFEKMMPRTGGKSFRQLLEEYQDLQSYKINVIISSCKYKIASLKKDTNRFLRDGMKEEDRAKLRVLEEQVGKINRDYSSGPLSQDKVKGLTKREILSYLEDKRKEIDKAVANSGVATQYKILNITTEYVDPVLKKKLDILASKEVSKLYEEDSSLSLTYGDRDTIVAKWRKRYLKAAKVARRKELIDKYIDSPEQFIMPSKV